MGMDFAFANRQYYGSLEFYNKKTSDLIGYTPLDPSTGYLNNYSNNAHTRTTGLDLTLHAQKNWGNSAIQASLLLGSASSKVTEALSPTLGYTSAILGYGIYEGKYVKPLLSIPFAGLDPQDGKPLGLLDGEVTANYADIYSKTLLDDLIDHGSAVPLYYGNLNFTVRYRMLSLQAIVDGKFKYFFRRTSVNYNMLYSRRLGNPDYYLRWQQPGDELTTTVPAEYYPLDMNRENFYTNSAALVEPGDHIRLQQLRLEVDALSLLHRARLKGLQLFVNVSNLGILWVKNAQKIDPVYADTGISPSRIYTLGLNVKF